MNWTSTSTASSLHHRRDPGVAHLEAPGEMESREARALGGDGLDAFVGHRVAHVEVEGDEGGAPGGDGLDADVAEGEPQLLQSRRSPPAPASASVPASTARGRRVCRRRRVRRGHFRGEGRRRRATQLLGDAGHARVGELHAPGHAQDAERAVPRGRKEPAQGGVRERRRRGRAGFEGGKLAGAEGERGRGGG